MLPRSWHPLCILRIVLLATAADADAQQPGILRLPLDRWQLHIGDDPRCAAIVAPDCKLQKYFFDTTRYGVEWQRIEVTLPPDLLESQQQLGLVVQGEDPVYEVFVDGQLIGGSGSFRSFLGPQDSRIVLKMPASLPSVANAGHPNPYLDGVEIQTEANLPLGVDAEVRYSEITFQLDPDSFCTLVTDGVVEATSPSGELYGFERTQAISSQPANTIAEAARQFGQEDDITVLSITRTLDLTPGLLEQAS